jgi:hypothetical protein
MDPAGRRWSGSAHSPGGLDEPAERDGHAEREFDQVQAGDARVIAGAI